MLDTRTSIKQQFDSTGYVVLPELFTQAECDEMVEAARRYVKETQSAEDRVCFHVDETCGVTQGSKDLIESTNKVLCFYEPIVEEGGKSVKPSASLQSVGHALHSRDPLFRCYTLSNRIKVIASELQLREPLVAVSSLHFINPQSEIKVRQEITFVHTEPTPPVKFLVALQDMEVSNCCLWVANGSHQSGIHRRLVRKPGSMELTFDRPAPIYAASSFKPVPLDKGSCIILHGNVVYRSSKNKSTEPIYTYGFHVIEKFKNSFSTDNWVQEAPGTPFLNLYEAKQIVD